MKIAGRHRQLSASERVPAPPPTEPPSAVEALERELQRRHRRRFSRAGLALVVAAAVAYGIFALGGARSPAPPPRFVAAAVEVRDITETVESSGKLKPLTEVKVGTQVSGRVVRVHVDFNHQVKKGQLLAEIDPSLFGAQVSQVAGQLGAARAQLERAEAREAAAKLVYDRTKSLHAESIASKAELDDAENALALARADVVAASAAAQGLAAQLASANTTLAYTKIYSPIDGIVIDRAVDPGQTVASSFSAPVLFVIAQDLSAMQVLADIDEADVGKIREGMAAEVRVDAFPERTFAGTVTQIRYSPTDVLGVVTYAAVLDVRNDQRELRPGMTATVTITAKSAKAVPAVRNAALRFKPKDTAQAGPALSLQPGERRVYVMDESAAPAPAGVERPAPAGGPGASSSDPVLAVRTVRIGISDGVWTELADGGLPVGTRVVTEERISPEEKRRKFLGIF